MPPCRPTNVALAERRQANARLAADNRRRLAEIERRLKALEDRVERPKRAPPPVIATS
jgi:hypothetical protein